MFLRCLDALKEFLSLLLTLKKILSERDNVIEFTPDKAGTFNIVCSMNMYKETFEVLESDGTKSNYVETAQTGGHSCSSNGEGCGCGG